jgi:hypothetical protein
MDIVSLPPMIINDEFIHAVCERSDATGRLPSGRSDATGRLPSGRSNGLSGSVKVYAVPALVLISALLSMLF